MGLGGLHGEELGLLLADHEEEAVLGGRGERGLVRISGEWQGGEVWKLGGRRAGRSGEGERR